MWLNDGASRTVAVRCGPCPARAECREYALAAREPHGVWGGLTPADRRAIIDARRADADRDDQDAAEDVL
jgi:hypothetical protein